MSDTMFIRVGKLLGFCLAAMIITTVISFSFGVALHIPVLLTMSMYSGIPTFVGFIAKTIFTAHMNG